jgi:HK97 family phage prohead protease
MGEKMILRTKSGEMAANGAALLDFLGVKNAQAGVQKVAGDVLGLAGVLVNREEKASDEGYQWTLSTFDLDRFGERIAPAGWDVAGYIHNPVVQWAHNYLIPAIGKIEGLACDNTGLHGRVKFNSKDYDPFGWAVGQRVAAGVIRAGSVGFRVLEIEIPDRETAKDGTSLIIRKQELVEFSICNVPANRYALQENHVEGLNTATFWGGLIKEQ